MCGMMNQTDIATYFKKKYGTKLDQARISRILRGEEAVSWLFAENMAQEFPKKSISEWKRATPEELKKAFAKLEVTA